MELNRLSVDACLFPVFVHFSSSIHQKYNVYAYLLDGGWVMIERQLGDD